MAKEWFLTLVAGASGREGTQLESRRRKNAAPSVLTKRSRPRPQGPGQAKGVEVSKTISIVRLAGAFLLAVADTAMAQYTGPPVIIQTPQVPPTQLNGAATLKPLTGPTLKDLPKAPTPTTSSQAAPPAAAAPCPAGSNC